MKRATARVLELPQPPVTRGRLLDASAIQRMIGGTPPPSLEWIYARVPYKMKLGHRKARWWEEDILQWLAGLRGEG